MSTEDDNKSNNKPKPLIIAVVALAAIAFGLGAFLALRTSQESPSKLSPTTPKVPFVRSPTQSSPSAPPLATPTPLRSPPATNPELLRSPLTTPTPLAPPPDPQNNDNEQQNEDRD